MICGMCGKRMKVGKFKVETHSTGYAYSTVSWYEGNELVFESPQTETTGFFCEDCGIAMGAFFRGRQVGFTSEYAQDLDDEIDTLPKKYCPECGEEIDIDYPRCPDCGHIF